MSCLNVYKKNCKQKYEQTCQTLNKDKCCSSSFFSYAMLYPICHYTNFFDIVGEKFGGYKFKKVTNAENAKIYDIGVIRDGDSNLIAYNLSLCNQKLNKENQS